MMTKRSNHIPTLIRMDATNITGILFRNRLNQKICGTITLHVNMVHTAQKYGPVARLRNTKRSYGLPLKKAVKNSTA